MMYETLIGFRYLRARKRTTFVSVITLISITGVTLGVAALCVVLSVMNGFQKELMERVIGANSHAIVSRYGIDFKDHPKVAKRLSRIKGVKSVAPMVLGEIMIAAGNKIAGVGVKGVSLQHKVHLASLKSAKVKGSLKSLGIRTPGELPGIAIGQDLATQLRVTLGDTVHLVSPVSLFGMQYRAQTTHMSFKVGYIFRFGMYQQDSKFCFISLKRAQTFFKLKESVSGLEVLVDDLYQIGNTKRSMIIKLGGWPYRVQDWKDLNGNLFKALQQNKLALGIILLFIILVASLNIAGTLILMVIEKSKDIAILRAMGASRRGVTTIFMTYGLYIGALGTLVGLALGFLICQLANHIGIKLDASVYFIAKLPVSINPLEWVVVALCALLISFLATIYPALQAARQQPVEVLRYE